MTFTYPSHTAKGCVPLSSDVMLIAYLIGMYFVGFYLATIVLMAASLLYLRVPKWQILISTIVIIGLVYGAFTMFLGVKLPVGLLFK